MIDERAVPAEWVQAYRDSNSDPWCATRRGVWWPGLSLWVDRLSLEPSDVPPTGTHSFSAAPAAGAHFTAVHGQVLNHEHGRTTDHVAVVLVTNELAPVLQTAICCEPADGRGLALAVLAALANAARLRVPSQLGKDCLTDKFIREIGSKSWESPGWSTPIEELPGQLVAKLLDVSQRD
jgi:hypothetical protein